MTEYQLLNSVEKRLIITEINHSLMYDNEAFNQIMEVIKNSKPSKQIKLFPKEFKNENQTN